MCSQCRQHKLLRLTQCDDNLSHTFSRSVVLWMSRTFRFWMLMIKRAPMSSLDFESVESSNFYISKLLLRVNLPCFRFVSRLMSLNPLVNVSPMTAEEGEKKPVPGCLRSSSIVVQSAPRGHTMRSLTNLNCFSGRHGYYAVWWQKPVSGDYLQKMMNDALTKSLEKFCAGFGVRRK